MTAVKLEELPRYSYSDYKEWEGRWELIDGFPYAMSPAPMIKHQYISNKIAWQLQELFKDCSSCKSLLPIDWKINEQTVVQPDNLVVCDDPFILEKSYITKAPKIIFEVLSKSTDKKDRGIKFDIYQSEGVKYYILVDTNDEIAKIYELKDGKYIKALDASFEKFTFELNSCDSKKEFDFSQIWK